MNCNNCKNNNALKEIKIKHVYGNVLRLAIPLTLRTIELVDGEINATDTPFVPSSEYPVKVVFTKKSAVAMALDATMKDGNIAYVEEKGKIPVGTYAITVTCNDDNGNPYRFKQNAVLYVADATIEAGIEETIEYEVTTWYLDAAIYLALKGEDGVGIADIETQSSGEIGGTNTVTFILTDGRTRSFNILNGSGAVDSDLDITSPSPISNSAVTAKFNEVSEELAELFGDVDYDSQSKAIRFWDKGKANVLASLDARPFIKDGMVSNVYISNNTLVITFNTDSGREAIGVPLTSVFNPNNYYTKTQVDSRIASAISNVNLTNYYTKSQVDNKLIGLMAKEDFVYEGSFNLKYGSAPEIVLSHIEGVSMYEEQHSRLFGTSDGRIKGYVGATGSQLFDYGAAPNGLVFLDKTSGLFYRWNGTTWQQVGGGGYEPPVGGIPKTDLASDVQTSLGKADTALQSQVQSDWNENDTSDPAYIANKPTIPEAQVNSDWNASSGVAQILNKPTIPTVPTNVSAFTNDAGYLTSQSLTGYATEGYVSTAIAGLVDSAPQTLDTLNELAEALGDDPNFATTVSTALGNKVDKVSGKGLSTEDYTSEEKTKLSGIATGAEVNVQADWNETNTSSDAYIANKPTIPAAQVQTDWNASSGMGVILNKPSLATVATSGSYSDLTNKPTIPTKVSDLTNDVGYTTNTGTVTGISVNGGAAQQPTNGVVSLTIAAGGDNDIVGISDGTASDGAVVFSKRNGDTVTLDFNHSHPQYALANSLSTVATSGDYDDLTGKPTNVSDFTNDSGFTSNAGTITGITMNGASKGTSGVVNLGTVITAHQDISGKANASEMAVSTSGDQTTITLKTGTSATVINQHQSLSGYAKYELLADEAAYTALSTKDSGTLYLIPES